MSLFQQTKELLDKITYHTCLETISGEWCYKGVSCYYTSNDKIFEEHILGDTHVQDDCTFINTDNGCGETITKVFLTSNQMDCEEFYDKYEDYM